jgi:Flp pilus assembly pilin Flp
VSVWRAISRLLRDESGPTATEYAVMIAVIALVALIAVQQLGNTINQMVADLDETIGAVYNN